MNEKTYVIGTADEAVEVEITEKEEKSKVLAAYHEKFTGGTDENGTTEK